MASCTFKNLVSSQCGGEVVLLELCTENIDSHLERFKMKGTKGKGPSGCSEIDLLLARAFAPDLDIAASTICASHRSTLAIDWWRSNRTCTLFHENRKKILCGLTIKQSKYLHRQLDMKATPGYGICRECKNDTRLKGDVEIAVDSNKQEEQQQQQNEKDNCEKSDNEMDVSDFDEEVCEDVQLSGRFFFQRC